MVKNIKVRCLRTGLLYGAEEKLSRGCKRRMAGIWPACPEVKNPLGYFPEDGVNLTDLLWLYCREAAWDVQAGGVADAYAVG